MGGALCAQPHKALCDSVVIRLTPAISGFFNVMQ